MNFSVPKKNILLLFIILLIISCGKGKDEEVTIPENVLSEEKFTKVLVDFALAESTSNMNVKNVSAAKIDSVYAFNPLKENGITKPQYDSAIAFYSKHPLLYKKIYEDVLVALSKMQVKKDSSKVDPTLK